MGIARKPVTPPIKKLIPYKKPKFSPGKSKEIKVAWQPYRNARKMTSSIKVAATNSVKVPDYSRKSKHLYRIILLKLDLQWHK